MIKTSHFKILALGSLTLTALVVSQGAFAHTRLEIPTVLEGITVGHAQSGRVLNQVVIGHGCPPAATRQPTFGTSVVFPNAISYTPIIGVNSNNAGATAGLAGAVFTTKPASSFYSPLAGIGQIIRTGGPWEHNNNKADTLGNVDGFWAGGKNYDQSISTPIDVPFYTHAITITSASCARSVTFELAIADVCNDVSTPSTLATDEQVLYWSPIPNFSGVPGAPFGTPVGDATRSIPVGPKFSNYDGYQDDGHTFPGDGWGSPATLTVTRNTTANPLPAGCTGNGGKGDDIFVFPSAQQINAELPVWSNANQTGTAYWQ